MIARHERATKKQLVTHETGYCLIRPRATHAVGIAGRGRNALRRGTPHRLEDEFLTLSNPLGVLNLQSLGLVSNNAVPCEQS